MREPRTSLEQAAVRWAKVTLDVFAEDEGVFTEADWHFLSHIAPIRTKELLLALNAAGLLPLPIDKYKDPGTDTAPTVKEATA